MIGRKLKRKNIPVEHTQEKAKLSRRLCSAKPLYLSQKYIITKKIGSGSFGKVYIAEINDNNDNKYVAVKVEEKKNSPVSRIINEYKIYKYIRKHGLRYAVQSKKQVSSILGGEMLSSLRVPEVYDLYQTPNYNIMFMQLLGPNLEHLFINSDRRFRLSTVLLIGIQIINLLKDLHKINYIHRDIKPSNFLIGRGQDTDQIYIMDFGLSRKYIHNGKHIKYRNDKSLIGTARYASCNMHRGIEPTRRDELESVGYMLIYFLKGKLPWQHLPKIKGKKQINVIGDKKFNTTVDELCYGIPSLFGNYIQYCRNLKFDETPDYDYICGLFCNYCSFYGLTPRYEWC